MKAVRPFVRFMLTLVPMAICLLLSACIGFLWVRSYQVGDIYRSVSRSQNGADYVVRDYRITIAQGEFVYDSTTFTSADREALDSTIRSRGGRRFGAPIGYTAMRPPRNPLINIQSNSVVGTLGFQYFSIDREDDNGVPWTVSNLAMPLWSLMLLTAAYPMLRYVISVVRQQRLDRIAQGLCPTCGLEVREEDSRCPNCDRPVAIAREF